MMPCPVALGLLVCEETIFDATTQNFSLLRVFRKLYVDRFPSEPKRFDVFAVLADGQGEGTMDLLITRLDTDAVIFSQRKRVNFPGRRVEVVMVFHVTMCRFPVRGKYLITLLIDGEWVAHREIDVLQES